MTFPGHWSEQSLLGALLIRGRLDCVPPQMRPEDFGDRRHQAIYRAMLELEQDERLTDTPTVYDHLPPDLTLKTYLASLLDHIPNPDAEGIATYSRTVMEEAAKRRRKGWAA